MLPFLIYYKLSLSKNIFPHVTNPLSCVEVLKRAPDNITVAIWQENLKHIWQLHWMFVISAAITDMSFLIF